jgi:hypothetical protein
MSDWFLRRWDPFDLTWSPWRHFEEIERHMNRTFRVLEREMELSRRHMLDFERYNAIVPESTSYSKE